MATKTSAKVSPLADRVVIRALEESEQMRGGLYIPDTAKEKPQQGSVLAVGPGRRSDQTGELIPLDVKVGDTVVYSKYGGTEITVDGDDLLILTSRDVLAIMAKASSTGTRCRLSLPIPAMRSPFSTDECVSVVA